MVIRYRRDLLVGCGDADGAALRSLPLVLLLQRREEPPHVHVGRDENTAKFWLGPVRLQSSRGFKPVEVRRIQRLVEEHREELLRSWDAYFNE